MNANLFPIYTNRVECGRRVTHIHANTFYETHDHQPEAGPQYWSAVITSIQSPIRLGNYYHTPASSPPPLWLSQKLYSSFTEMGRIIQDQWWQHPFPTVPRNSALALWPRVNCWEAHPAPSRSLLSAYFSFPSSYKWFSFYYKSFFQSLLLSCYKFVSCLIFLFFFSRCSLDILQLFFPQK